MTFLLVKHGGGEERIRLSSCMRLSQEALAALDSDSRYWLFATIQKAYSDGERTAEMATTAKWQQAAAEKRIKTRKLPKRGLVKVWIEDKPIKAA